MIWRVDVAFPEKDDWKYEGNRAGAGRGGRTHTFGLRSPAQRLRNAAAFTLPGVAVRGGRPIVV